MPIYQIGSRLSQGADMYRGYKYAGTRVPLIVHVKHRPGKYTPHYGAKESAKFAARNPAA